MKRLLIADIKSYNNNGKSTGHYFAVAQNYLDLYSDCCEVKIAGGPIFTTHFNPKDIFLLPYDYMPNMNWLKSKWRVLMNCKYIFNNTRPDDIIVIQQSGLSTAILGIAMFAKKKRNIYIIAYDTDAVSSPIKKIIYHLAKGKIKGLLCSDKHISDIYKISSRIITDYIYPNTTNNLTVIPFENKKYDIAIVGSIWPDKGVIEAAEVLANTKYKVLIAGKANKQLSDTLNNICKSAKNIDLHIGFINDNDYYTYIQEARFCILNYHGVYENRSSGVALDILFNGTPIIGHKCKALEFVENEHVGQLFDDIKQFDFSTILQKDNYCNYLTGITNCLNKQREYKWDVIKYLCLK